MGYLIPSNHKLRDRIIPKFKFKHYSIEMESNGNWWQITTCETLIELADVLDEIGRWNTKNNQVKWSIL